MKSTRKIFVALLLVLTLMMGVMAISSSAADGNVTVYFENNWNWTDVHCYAFVGDAPVGDAWPGTLMTKVGSSAAGKEVYSVSVPSNASIIFNGIKDNGSGDRDESPAISTGIVEGAGWKMEWNGANAVIPFTYDANAKFVFNSVTVAGNSEAVFGTAWDSANASNDMTLGDDGLYIKVYEGVAKGSYEFKCVGNYSWDTCWPGANYVINVTEDNATLTITFNPETFEVKATTHKHSFTVTNSATCTDDGVITSVCSCGYTEETVASKLGHNYVDGVCANCGGAEPAEHVHVYAWEITTAPTCTAEGVKTFTCSCTDSYTETIAVNEHTYKFGKCSACGVEDPNYVVDYYLVGWINDADCGFGSDKTSLRSEYKFVDGKVVVTFLSDSYVFVKTSDNQRWYMAGFYDPSAISAILYDTEDTSLGEKLFVPGGVEVEFTLIKDGSDLVLSYEAEEPIYTVAGSEGLCGTDWDTSDPFNEMYILGDGTYEIVYLGIAAGTYEFKIVKNNSWDNGAWGADGGEANYVITVTEDNSIVNINFNPSTKAISANAAGVPEQEPGEDETPDSGETPDNGETPDDGTVDETPAPKLNFFQKIWQAILNFFMSLFGKK